jgi:aspartate racemase
VIDSGSRTDSDPAPDPGKAPVLGIVGGMGPLASAELVGTIYRQNLHRREQLAPRCLLVSDPTFPDRTETILRGRADELAELGRCLAGAVESLLDQGAHRVVIACFTVHRVLGELPDELRRRVVSLVDLVVEELAADPGIPRLLLATTGSRRGGVFTSHPEWPAVAASVREVPEEDQGDFHDLLYRIKSGEDPAESVSRVAALEERYGARGSIFGCTELHLLQRHMTPERRARVIDPLWTVATGIDAVLATPEC